jgi:hypothetical protein
MVLARPCYFDMLICRTLSRMQTNAPLPCSNSTKFNITYTATQHESRSEQQSTSDNMQDSWIQVRPISVAGSRTNCLPKSRSFFRQKRGAKSQPGEYVQHARCAQVGRALRRTNLDITMSVLSTARRMVNSLSGRRTWSRTLRSKSRTHRATSLQPRVASNRMVNFALISSVIMLMCR